MPVIECDVDAAREALADAGATIEEGNTEHERWRATLGDANADIEHIGNLVRPHDRYAALVHHLPGTGGGLIAALDDTGRLVFRSNEDESGGAVYPLLDGVEEDGEAVYPAMPYMYYTKLYDEDVSAIWAYLETVEPVENEVEVNQLPFPFNVRASVQVWQAMHLLVSKM